MDKNFSKCQVLIFSKRLDFENYSKEMTFAEKCISTYELMFPKLIF